MRRLELLLPPPIILLALLSLAWLLKQLLPGWELWATQSAWRLAVVLSLCGLAVLIALASLVSFRRAHTTIDPHHPEKSSQLVRTGCYRFSRNPMYLSLLLVLLAGLLYLNHLLLLPLGLLFPVYITRFQIVPEERVLEAQFGEEYRRYCGEVRRWLGF